MLHIVYFLIYAFFFLKKLNLIKRQSTPLPFVLPFGPTRMSLYSRAATFKVPDDINIPGNERPRVGGSMQGSRGCLITIPWYWNTWHCFAIHAIQDHGKLIIRQPFALHFEFRSELVSSTCTRMHFPHSLLYFIVLDAWEVYVIQQSPIQHVFEDEELCSSSTYLDFIERLSRRHPCSRNSRNGVRQTSTTSISISTS